MGKPWEVRGLFGNEYAMEQALEDLKKLEGLEAVILDRRNLSVRMPTRDEESEAVVKRTIEIHHGYVESEAPLGRYDSKKQEAKLKKMRDAEKKRGH
jgi:hypothetical protein